MNYEYLGQQTHSDSVEALQFSNNQNFLASGSNDSYVKIWDANDGFSEIQSIKFKDFVNCIGFSGDDNKIAIGVYNTLNFWGWDSDTEIYVYNFAILSQGNTLSLQWLH